MDPVIAIVAIVTKQEPGRHKRALKEWFDKGGKPPLLSNVRKALGDGVKVTDAKLIAMGCVNDGG